MGGCNHHFAHSRPLEVSAPVSSLPFQQNFHCLTNLTMPAEHLPGGVLGGRTAAAVLGGRSVGVCAVGQHF